MSEQVSTDNAPTAIGPYSQAIKAEGFVFVSGQIPVNPADGTMAGTIAEQANQALLNLKNILEAAGGSLSKVVKTTVFIQNMNDFTIINKVYAEYFSQPYPARSCVEVAKLPKGALLEIEAIACLNDD